ncbi:pyridoxamine 5'-phosphate oxidase family protein [Streptomyces sp. NPDC090445]|uniref:pyridoxamine 5'-phosphate oxidase family protein n=1 Tax=Streptomyces sp. NPDC090445 TaxID=3365963 RepID=UPI0037FBA0A6
MTENSHGMLRSFPVLPADVPSFDTATTPHDPVPMFVRWLTEAVEQQVPGPHVMTLFTTEADGPASSRVLICKDVSQDGQWYFAAVADSLKGHQPDGSHATLTFHWPRIGRQIRVRGTVAPAAPEVVAADYSARPPGSHAGALAHLTADRDLIAPAWTLYSLIAHEVELCQADHDQRHTRLRHERTGSTWQLERLRP